MNIMRQGSDDFIPVAYAYRSVSILLFCAWDSED